METTYQVTIGKYTYESNPEDKQIPGFWIRIMIGLDPAIFKLVPTINGSIPDLRECYIITGKDTYDKLVDNPAIDIYPLTYSNNPFILSPTK